MKRYPLSKDQMAGYRSTQIRKPSNETEFEKNCVVLFKEFLNDPNVKRLGTRGQRQHGVDLVAHRDRDTRKIVGVQCKLKTGRSRLTAKEVRDEVTAALSYTPPLTEYFVVATSKDDTRLTQLAQQLMQDQEAAGRRLHIEVWGWDTLQEKIDQYEPAKQAFDPGFSPSIASQDRKLDALIAGQSQTATKDQLAAIASAIGATGKEALTRLPATLANRELTEGLSRALRRRGFAHTDIAVELAALAERAIDGDLSLAPSAIRSNVCDLAARANTRAQTPTVARRFREHAATIDASRDFFITDALLKEAEGDPNATLRLLRTRSEPEARSALFTALTRQRGANAALSWAHGEGLAPSDFSPPGIINLVLKHIERGAFEEALANIAQTPEEYFDECPALRLLRAQLSLTSILPSDQKTVPFQGLPINPRSLHLAAGQKSQEQIRSASEDIRTLLGMLEELILDYLESFLSEFDLWLRLEDLEVRETARNQLTAEISDPTTTLRRVRLALAYNIPFNQEALQRHLNRQQEIGGWTGDERFAAFLMAYHSDDPKKVSEFFDRYHADLFAQTDLARSMLAGIEIEALARTGRFEEARRHISLHRETDLTPKQAGDIEKAVAHIEKGDEAENLRQRYVESQSLTDLHLLISELRARQDTRQLADYAPVLARETHTLEHFDLAIKSLFNTNRHSEVIALAEELPEVYTLDDEYAAIKGWSLYLLGRIMEARAIARELLGRRKAAGDRELAINTAIETGDWGHLQAILAREAADADALSAKDLVRLARLALETASPYVDHFRDAALRQAPDDPHVNLAAYVLATERGEEYRGPQAHEWLAKAIEHSGPDGPVRSMSLREVVDQAPHWNEHAEHIYRLLRQAELPLFVAAKGVRRQLIDLTLGQILRNTDPYDLRIKYPVLAFSGARPVCELSGTKSITFDITALITLYYLGLLDEALEYFECPVIAPKTLSMLFMERQFLKVQQPTEVAKAERIQTLIASGRLKVAASASGTSPEASKAIGRDLAALLYAAQQDGGLVVRTAPVPKLGSFLDETVDMNGYASLLTDTLSLVSFLAGSGKIDAAKRKSAETYLKQVDVGWPVTNVIDESTTLYLDDLAVTYLDHAGVLDALTESVTVAFVHGDLDRRMRDLLRHGKHANELLSAIERIRAVINRRAESGLIGFSARHRGDENLSDESARILESAPTLDLMSDLSGVDAAIADDRCLNKLPTWSDASGHSAHSVSVIDVLATLRGTGQLDDDAYWRARHQLRSAGYYAVPLESAELLHHLSVAPITDGRLRETPELRAVRESLALPIVNSCFIPTEVAWLNGMRLSVLQTIRALWLGTSRIDRVKAQSDWLLSILQSPLEWCLTPEDEMAWAAARQQTAFQAAMMLMFVGTSNQRRKCYFAWLEEKVVTPLQKANPDIWDATLGILKSYIPHLMEIDDSENPQ